MADLSAVLRKTIDALPAATPQLRAKVYEKARAAVQRQITQADPPLAAEMVEARQHALENAIEATEAHYRGAEASMGAVVASAPSLAPVTPPVVASPPPPIVRREPGAETRPVGERAEPDRPAGQLDSARFSPRPEPSFEKAPERLDESRFSPPTGRFDPPAARVPPLERAIDGPGSSREEPEARIGEVGPMSEPPMAGEHARGYGDETSGARTAAIPEADLTAPNYTRARRRSSGRSSLFTGVAALLFIGALGAAGYLYREEISQALTGGDQIAETQDGTSEEPADVAATTEPGASAEPAAPDPSARQFTQRLLPDGTEVDEGPVATVPNAFDEGTDIAAASILANEVTGVTAPPAATEVQPAEAAAGDPAAVPVGQRAVFYEERSTDRPGAQLTGNVVWSVINEPPAAGQPAEPAIRAVADVGETNLQMTMTIRRNADETLPASHVIELLFDTPNDFPGGEIENVQRLALKPTEQDRGEPLIGVAGKISDGFFIIALNDLQQAVDSNLALMANQQWIDIPMAYASGQRALMSLEKGIPGERVFREVIEAWAERT